MQEVHDSWTQLSRLKLSLAARTAIAGQHQSFLETMHKTQLLMGEQQSYSSKALRINISTKLWLDRAQEAMTLAESIESDDGRLLLLKIAEAYEKFASEISSSP